METLINYLDAMFAAYPDNETTRKAKGELLVNMEDRYKELLSSGKSQNEPVGEVIAQFGNIEELMDSLNVKRTAAEEELEAEPVATDEEVTSYIGTVQSSSRKTALGVLMCIISPALLIYLASRANSNMMGDSRAALIGVAAMMLLVAGAVALFIIGGMALKPFDAEKGYPKQLSARMKQVVASQQKAFRQTYVMWLCVGIGLCVLCPIPVLLYDQFRAPELCVVMLLAMVAVGVFCIVRVAGLNNAFKKLLRQEEYNKSTQQLQVEKAIEGVLWPVVTAAFLILGFTRGAWGTAWIIFPIAGILQDMVIKIVKASRKSAGN